MQIFNEPQGSDAWKERRRGKPTASQFDKFLTKTGQYSQSQTAKTYMYKLLCERLLKVTIEDDLSNFRWPRHGIEQEPHAVQQFQIATGLRTEAIGFALSDDGRFGCSPDRRVIGKKQLVEIKCPAPWTHMQYAMEGLDNDYVTQIQGQLLVTRYDCVHFYSYYGDLAPVSRTALPMPIFLSQLRDAVQRFCDDLDKLERRAERYGTETEPEILRVLRESIKE